MSHMYRPMDLFKWRRTWIRKLFSAKNFLEHVKQLNEEFAWSKSLAGKWEEKEEKKKKD